MAGHGNIANLKSWKPGQSGNPNGKAGMLPPEIRTERKQNQARLIQLLIKLFAMTDTEAALRLKEEATTQLEKACQSMIAKAREGDTGAFKYLMELITGRIPENDHDGFTEEDIRILNRVKEVVAEQRAIGNDGMGPSDKLSS